ncbi:MAG: TM1266 family iron-only hydrogenase system putative regulator [Halanaerobiales bacterium]
MDKRIAVIGAILDRPKDSQFEFNKIVADYKGIVRGRLGLPLNDKGISAISLTVIGPLDEINSLTGKLGNIKGVSVKTSISKKEL